MTSVDVTVHALGSAMHSGMFGGPAPDPVVGLIQLLASLHDEHGNTTVDGLDATQTWTGVEYAAEHLRSRIPWELRCEIERVAVGDPFVGALDGPAFRAMKSAMETAYGRAMATE